MGRLGFREIGHSLAHGRTSLAIPGRRGTLLHVYQEFVAPDGLKYWSAVHALLPLHDLCLRFLHCIRCRHYISCDGKTLALDSIRLSNPFLVLDATREVYT